MQYWSCSLELRPLKEVTSAISHVKFALLPRQIGEALTLFGWALGYLPSACLYVVGRFFGVQISVQQAHHRQSCSVCLRGLFTSVSPPCWHASGYISEEPFKLPALQLC